MGVQVDGRARIIIFLDPAYLARRHPLRRLDSVSPEHELSEKIDRLRQACCRASRLWQR